MYDDLSNVRTLCTLPPDRRTLAQLFSRNNANGLTPLEVCEQRQRRLRERTELDPLRVWTGFQAHALRIIYLLKRAMGEDLGMSEDQFVTQNQYGCTCEQLTDGSRPACATPYCVCATQHST